MNWLIMEDYKYTRQHEWARWSQEEGVVVGITDYAQSQLGNLVFAELPTAGDSVRAGENLAVIESVKAVADVYAPVSGTIVAVNQALEDAPELLNDDPYGKGWIARLEAEDASEWEELLTGEEYEEFVRQEEGL